MFREMAAKTLYVLLAVTITVVPTMNTAVAGVIATEEAFASELRESRIDDVQRLLSEDHVRNTLIRYGVDPEMASKRVTALTDAELMTLEARLDELPAGGTGVVEVVGIVAIVLIVLELLDVTDIFKSF
jgi:heme exporter protein D